MKRSYISVVLYSLTHLLVDMACAYLVFFRIFGTADWYLCTLLYNFCAFALQMPVGLLADRWNRNSLCAAFGCILVAVAFLPWNSMIMTAVIAGTGNCMFHVGGGIDILNLGRKKSGMLGIFVAPGAFGLYLGTMYGRQGMVVGVYIISALLLAAVSILFLQYTYARTFRSGNEQVSFRMASLAEADGQNGLKAASAFGAMALMLLVVCLRSYVGLNLAFPWKGSGSWGVILVLAVVLGKMAGGILADAFGVMRTTVVSLGLAVILFPFSAYPPAGTVAVLLFNMTMPVTLWAVSRILPGSKGFTFGLLTFGLFLGFIPVYMGLEPLFTDGIGYACASAVSLVLLFAGLVIAGAGWRMRKQTMSGLVQ